MTDASRAITQQAAPEHLRDYGVSARTYAMIYRGGGAPWEIAAPQPEVVRIEERGGFGRRVLDIGCGLGSNAQYLAERGHEVVAVDFVAEVIEQAKSRVQAKSLPIEFQALDIFDPGAPALGLFDTLLDSATFHGFSDDERARYGSRLAELAPAGAVLHILGVGIRETRPGGPRRLSREAIEAAFDERDWDLRSCRDTLYAASIFPGGAKAVAAELWRR